MPTYDQQTIDNTGAFLVGELERLDPTLHKPLSQVTWSRDINLRNDVSIADEMSSFTNSSFASPGQDGPGMAWIGKDTNAITGMQLDIAKTVHALTLWGMQLGWTLPELAAAQQVGRPVDQQKFDGMQIKWQMDTDKMVYLGDETVGATGLLNTDDKAASASITGGWTAQTDVDAILQDVNDTLNTGWSETGYAVCPSKLLLPPERLALLSSMRIGTAAQSSVLEYIKNNCLTTAVNNQPLDIQSVKWLSSEAPGNDTSRMVAYTNAPNYVRFPMVPLQRTPIEYRDLRQLVTYYGRLGQTEFVYPGTVVYADNV